MFKMRALLPFLLLANTALAQSPNLLRQLDSATVWEGVRIKAEQVFGEKNVEPSFKIKNKEKRKYLVAALEGQFQVNVGEGEIKSLKRARDLSGYIFRAQQGAAFFSKANFKGKAERLVGERKNCKENADCLNFIGSLIVPKGWKAILFSQPNFKGEQLVIDAIGGEIPIANFSKINFENGVSTTDKSFNWREGIGSIKVNFPKSRK